MKRIAIIAVATFVLLPVSARAQPTDTDRAMGAMQTAVDLTQALSIERSRVAFLDRELQACVAKAKEQNATKPAQ